MIDPPRRLLAGLFVSAALFFTFAPVVVRADELQDVAKLVKGGKFDDAEKRADAFLKNDPKNAQMRFLRGVIASQTGRRDEAITIFTRLTQDFPELPEPYNNLAVIYGAQGQYDKAREALETAIRVAPGDATAYENLGDIYAALAARAYRDARRRDANAAAPLRKLDAVRALLANQPAPVSVATPPAAPAPSAAAPAPDTRPQRNVGMASPVVPSTLSSFPAAQAPEIIVSSAGSAVPQGSNVVGIGGPDAASSDATTPLAGASTRIPPDPANPIPAITDAVNRWAASRSVRPGAISIRVDGEVATARFREEDAGTRPPARRSVARNRALTLRHGDDGWMVTDDRVES